MSQFGEDQFLERYLVDNEIFIAPYIIDIGAGDGQTISNSRLFIEKYFYAGLLVDINEPQINEAKELYKDNPNVHCIVSGVSGQSGYYQIREAHDWTLNSINWAKFAQKGWKRSKTISEVVSVGTSELAKRNKMYEDRRAVEDSRIGILSIDVEDRNTELVYDLISNTKIRPAVIIVEGNTAEEQSDQKLLLGDEYQLLTTLAVNQIFILKEYVV
jgi:hypothetical protein